jgi:ElaB/YqjD/DUF883 family membrane-anchored ribosome-binding protein
MNAQQNHEQANGEAQKTNSAAREDGASNATTEHSEDAMKAIRDDLNNLKASVAALLEHLGGGAKAAEEDVKDGIKNEAGRLSQQLRELLKGLNKNSSKTTSSLEHQIQAKPLTTLLIAFGLGFVFSSLIGRRK